MASCLDQKTGRLISQYELGLLDAEEREQFEQHLLACDACFTDLSQMAGLVSAVRDHRAELLESLQIQGLSFEDQRARLLGVISPAREGKKRFRRLLNILDDFLTPKVLIPAAVLVSALILFLILSPTSQQENPYWAYLTFDRPLYGGIRGNATTEPQGWFFEGMKHYNAGRWSEAIDSIQKAVGAAPDSGNWWLYLGISYYCHYEANRAEAALEKAQNLTHGTAKTRAKWYLAQAHLLAGDARSASRLLRNLISGQGEYAASADSLLEKIKAVKKR